MQVQTRSSRPTPRRERVRSAVKMLTELLMADHPPPAPRSSRSGELRARGAGAAVRDRQAAASRRQTERPRDDSSLVIAVDHSACILCDRCIRGCNDIRNNQVIGRMGKGYTARIAFDLDVPMGGSSCVVLRRVHGLVPDRGPDPPRVVEARSPGRRTSPSPDLSSHELIEHPLETSGASSRGSRYAVPAVEQPGRSSGVISRRARSSAARANSARRPSSSRRVGRDRHPHARRARRGQARARAFRPGRRSPAASPRKLRTRPGEERTQTSSRSTPRSSCPTAGPRPRWAPGDLFGEMTCMSYYPRSATVPAARGLHAAGDAPQRPLHHAAQPDVPPRCSSANYRERARSTTTSGASRSSPPSARTRRGSSGSST